MNAFRKLPGWVKCGFGFAAVGFVVAVTLCAYTFYLTSHHRIGNELLFIGLCPPSIAAIALDNAGVAGGLVGWLFIAVANAALYGAFGFAGGLILARRKDGLSKRQT